MPAFDPETTLSALLDEYSSRAQAIRHDLARSHSADFAEQAQQRQNDEVLEALLAEAEAGMRQVGLAKLRLNEGTYGQCPQCGEAISPERLEIMPAAELCLACSTRAEGH